MPAGGARSRPTTSASTPPGLSTLGTPVPAHSPQLLFVALANVVLVDVFDKNTGQRLRTIKASGVTATLRVRLTNDRHSVGDHTHGDTGLSEDPTHRHLAAPPLW